MARAGLPRAEAPAKPAIRVTANRSWRNEIVHKYYVYFIWYFKYL